jgi:hypothetical protein
VCARLRERRWEAPARDVPVEDPMKTRTTLKAGPHFTTWLPD